MSVFNDLINGNGIPKFKWVAIRFTGNTIAKEAFMADNYSAALAQKLRHKHRQQITLELIAFDLRHEGDVALIGDESNWLDLKEKLKTLT